MNVCVCAIKETMSLNVCVCAIKETMSECVLRERERERERERQRDRERKRERESRERQMRTLKYVSNDVYQWILTKCGRID